MGNHPEILMKIAFFARRNVLLTAVVSFVLAIALLFGDGSAALAAKSGGRIGGGSFRAPTRTMPAPSRGGGGGGYAAPGYGGGGFGFPFIIPFFGFGGGFGSLFTILIFFAIANFLVRSFSNLGSGNSGSSEGYGYSAPRNYDNPPVSVTKVQVGLLANARELQAELDALANRADTGTASGRAQVLQEATLALLRHPEYWVYGSADAVTAPLSSAEAKFNQFSLAERSKFTEETLSNVNSQLKQAELKGLLEGNGDRPLELPDSREYILVTVLAGIEGKMDIPAINDSSDLRRALQALGGIGSDRLLAVEVLWTPQAQGDTLTTEDILAAYPDLKLV